MLQIDSVGAPGRRSHNLLYVPPGAFSLRFDLRNLEDGAANFLDVVLGTSVLDVIDLDSSEFASNPDFATLDFLIPGALRGQALTLDFNVTQADDFFSPSVQTDNLVFVPEPGTFLLVAGGLMLLSIPGFGPGLRRRGDSKAVA